MPDAPPRKRPTWQQSRESGVPSGEHFAFVAGSIFSGVGMVVPSGGVGGTFVSGDGAVAVVLAVAGAGVGDVGSMGARLAHEIAARANDTEAKTGPCPRRPPKNGSFVASGPRRIRRR
jgi:hypothetical protein